jgi:hypothetical protein
MENVKSFLTGLFNEDDTNRVVSRLEELGAESMTDVLNLDVETDLTDTIPVLKRRRLGESLKVLKNSSAGKNVLAVNQH